MILVNIVGKNGNYDKTYNNMFKEGNMMYNNLFECELCKLLYKCTITKKIKKSTLICCTCNNIIKRISLGKENELSKCVIELISLMLFRFERIIEIKLNKYRLEITRNHTINKLNNVSID